MRMTSLAGIAFMLALATGCGPAGPAPDGETSSETSSPALPLASIANWSLDSGTSRIGFVSIKSGEIIEVHHFSNLSGQITATGSAVVDIPLDQVETKIDLRNERMREMFFETGTYPVAKITATVNPEDFKSLSSGMRMQTQIEGILSLHGVEAPVTADVFVTRIAEQRVEIASVEPVIVYLEDFNLTSGLEALREVAGLPSITASSPVTFTLVFEAVDA